MTEQNKLLRPTHRLDNTVGFHVFSDNPGEITAYGNTHFRWTSVPNPYYVNGWMHQIDMSIDGGQTWKSGNSCWDVYNAHGVPWFGYRDAHSPHRDVNKPIFEARDAFNRKRRSQLNRERRAAFKQLPLETQQQILIARREAWLERNRIAEERNAVKTARIMNQMLELGPRLVRLKEDIDTVLSMMAKGGIDREFPHWTARKRQLWNSEWLIGSYKRHITRSHERNGR